MRTYRQFLLLFLPLGFCLFNCRSERAAFVFSPAEGTSVQTVARPPKQAETRPIASSVRVCDVIAASLATSTNPPVRRRHAAPFVARPHRAALPAAPFFNARQAKKSPGFEHNGFLGKRSTERAFLISGISTALLGLGANYLAVGSGSRMALLTTGQYLLWMSAFLLLAWFVLLLLRVREEDA